MLANLMKIVAFLGLLIVSKQTFKKSIFSKNNAHIAAVV